MNYQKHPLESWPDYLRFRLKIAACDLGIVPALVIVGIPLIGIGCLVWWALH